MFDIFLAGSEVPEIGNYIKKNNYPRLLSQLNDWGIVKKYVQSIRDGETSSKLFIDSGAFSAKTLGVFVDIDEYIRKMNEIHDTVYCFANLDVIPNSSEHSEIRITSEKGFDNFIHIVENCKCPEKCVGVYHAGDPEDILYRYIDYYKENPQLKFFSLGGVVGGNSEQVFVFLSKYSAIVKKELPNIKLHLLGFTKLQKLKYINADSSDSTTWIMVSANGSILTDYGVMLVSDVQKHKPGNALCQHSDYVKELEKYVGNKGFTLEELSKDYKARMRWNITYIQEFSNSIQFVGNVKQKKKLI